MKRLTFAAFAVVLAAVLSACSVKGETRYNGLAGMKVTMRDSWNVDYYDTNFTETPEASGDLDFLEYEVDEIGDVYYYIVSASGGEPEDEDGDHTPTDWGFGMVSAHLPYGEFRDLGEYADTYLLNYFDEDYFGDFEEYSLYRKSYGQVTINGIAYYKAAYEHTEHSDEVKWNYDVYAAKTATSEGDLYLLLEVEYCGGDRVSKAFAKNFVKSVSRLP